VYYLTNNHKTGLTAYTSDIDLGQCYVIAGLTNNFPLQHFSFILVTAALMPIKTNKIHKKKFKLLT